MKNLVSFALTVAAALPLAAQQPGAQPPRYSEQVQVNAVLVDAIVTDRSGHQILGLNKDDFIVRENGTPQQIDSVDYFTNRRLLTEQESKAPFKAEQIRSDRYFVIFLDKPAAPQLLSDVIVAEQAAVRFVKERLQPGDHVAVVGHDVRLKVFSDFSADKAALTRALDDAVRFGLGVTRVPEKAGHDSILKNVDMARMMSGSGTVYEAVEVLAQALRPIQARKELILISPGVLEQGQTIFAGMPSESRYYRPMIQALNAANVTVYPINLLRDASIIDPIIHTTLEHMAAETNGQYFRGVVNFDNPLRKIEHESSGYYLITYRSNKPRGASGYQKIDVSLRNPEFQVRAREGYTYGDNKS
jgi:VWFA-related protein